MSTARNNGVNPSSKDGRKASRGPIVTASIRDIGSATSGHGLHPAPPRANATLQSKPKSANSGATAPTANPTSKKRAGESSPEKAPKKTRSGNDQPESLPIKAPKTRSGHDQPDKPIIACPYYKHNPRTHRFCGRSLIRENTDMRRHLERYHLQPLHCPICKEQFGKGCDEKGKKQRDEHIKQEGCKFKNAPLPAGITEDQLKKIKKCDKGPGSKERNWFQTWDILFPNSPQPSTPLLTPESMVQDSAAQFRQFLRQRKLEGPQDSVYIINLFVRFFRGDELTPEIMATIPGSMVAGPTSLEPMFGDAAGSLDIDWMQLDTQFDEALSAASVTVPEAFSLDGQLGHGGTFIMPWGPNN